MTTTRPFKHSIQAALFAMLVLCASAKLAYAMGSWTELWTTPALFTAEIGSTYMVAAHGSPGCSGTFSIVRLATSETISAPSLGCRAITAVASDTEVFVADSTNKKIKRLQASGSSWVWTDFADTSGDAIVKILLSNSYVYWQDSAGTYRKAKSGGAVSSFYTSGTLLALDDNYLYQQFVSGSSYMLRRIQLAPGALPTVLRTQTVPFTDLTVDSTDFYWVENSGGGTHRLRSMNKSSFVVSTVHDSTDVVYVEPKSNDASLYWFEYNGAAGSFKIRRKNLVNGNHVTDDLSSWLSYSYRFELQPTRMYMLGVDLISDDHSISLYRGTL